MAKFVTLDIVGVSLQTNETLGAVGHFCSFGRLMRLTTEAAMHEKKQILFWFEGAAVIVTKIPVRIYLALLLFSFANVCFRLLQDIFD